jgi:hypothetical protein
VIRRFIIGPTAIAISALLLSGCSGCSGCGEPPLATLVRHKKSVERDLQAHVGTWQKVAGEDQFHDGDGLRTGDAAEATLELAGGAKVRVEADTTIRFRRNAPNAAAATSVDIESGLAEVEAGKGSVGIKTRFGLAILSSGGKLRVDRVDGVERYRVDLGDAVFPTEAGATQALTQGQELDIGIGLAQMEPVVKPAPEPIAAPVPVPIADAGVDAADNAEQPNDDTTSGPPKDTLAVVDHADFELPLGGNVTVNDPAPPTAIGFSLTASCPEGGALEVERRRAHGKSVNVALKPGTHRYRVFCIDAAGKVARTPTARGTIRVRRATGSAQLPTTAPRNRIDVDGRRYTVMFQNLLPEIEVRWPDAPTANSYTMERTFNGQTTTERSNTPSVRLAAGQVPEGEHRLRFKAVGGSTATSGETTLSVRFDNAAPSVSLRAPAATGFEPGSEVQVTGVAIADTRVSILGRAIELDRQHRFDTTVSVPGGSHAFAVRIEHPRTGVNYYVRRERGTR